MRDKKKLLILGADRLIASIVLKAKEMGIYTIVTASTPYEKSPAKMVADCCYDIDFSDYEAVRELINEEEIDGVFTGFSDAYLPHYMNICDESGLPCYIDSRQLEIATNKVKFKQACTAADLPVIPGICAISYGEVIEFSEENGFPIIIKPSDNSGSRGVIKCENSNDLEDAFSYALSFSRSGQLIVEKYLDCEGVTLNYFASNGEIRLSTSDDRHMYRSIETGSSIATYSTLPSKYTERYIDELNEKVIEMLVRNGFREGMLSIQTFVDKNSFYLYEMAYRPSGGQFYYLVEDQNGIDELGYMINYALSIDSYVDMDKITPFFADTCISLRILGKAGSHITIFEGLEDVRADKHVVMVSPKHAVGSIIGKDGTTEQVVATVLLKYDKNENHKEIARELLGKLRVENEKHESVIWIDIE